MKTALITGVEGQDGRLLSALLLSKGYRVVGTSRNPGQAARHVDGIELVEADMLNEASLRHAIEVADPDEIYNLAAQSSVAESHRQPVMTADVNGLGVFRLLEAVRTIKPTARFCQASTSQIFGREGDGPRSETSAIAPVSPYGAAKAIGHWMVQYQRSEHGLHACAAILFNHESPYRSVEFVSRKISAGVAAIAAGRQQTLILGNLDAARDWGWAEDYVTGMWLTLQQNQPDDFVFATGQSHSVRELCEIAFKRVGLDWRKHVETDPAFVRDHEPPAVLGDASKARSELGWTPTIDFVGMVHAMVDADVALLNAERR